MKKIILAIKITLIFIIFSLNLKSQIVNIVPSDKLPSYVIDNWKSAGSSVINEPIEVKEFIDVTDENIIPDPNLEQYYFTYDGNNQNADIIQGLTNLVTFDVNDPKYTIIYFPDGLYYLNEPVTISKKGVILKGACSDNTLLFSHLSPASYYQRSCIEVSGVKCGIEDLKLRQHLNYTQTFTFSLSGTNCWIRDVESELTNRFHVRVLGTYNTITDCYFHDSHCYGSGGEGYGVCLDVSPDYNLVENNIFEHLRHSIVIQGEPYYNVIGYNFSREPYKTEWWGSTHDYTPDLFFHGREFESVSYDGPRYNLCEGNYVEKIWFDDTHGASGPWNLLFRNFAEGSYAGKEFRIADVWGTDDEYRQIVVGCNAEPAVHDFNKINEYGFQTYWHHKECDWTGIFCWIEGDDWANLPSNICSFYKTAKPDFLPDWWTVWPFVPDGTANWAKNRYDQSITGAYSAATCSGWYPNYYKNMCAPGLFYPGIEITTPPALQKNYKACEYIKASYIIPQTERFSKVTYIAGEYIELLPGFETADGMEFEAYIGDIPCQSGNKMLIVNNENPDITDYLSGKTEKKDYLLPDNSIFLARPNPFNNSTDITFSIEKPTNVRLYITNIYGIPVMELQNRQIPEGVHNINISGSSLRPGIYYCILETETERKTIKLVKM